MGNNLQKIVYVQDSNVEGISGQIGRNTIVIGQVTAELARESAAKGAIILSTLLDHSDMKNIVAISENNVMKSLAYLSMGFGKIQVVTDNAEGVILGQKIEELSDDDIRVSIIDLRLRIIPEELDPEALIISNVMNSPVEYPNGATVFVPFETLDDHPQGFMSLVPSPIEWNIWQIPVPLGVVDDIDTLISNVIDRDIPEANLTDSSIINPRALMDRDIIQFTSALSKVRGVLDVDDVISLWNQFIMDSRRPKNFFASRYVEPTTRIPMNSAYDVITNVDLDIPSEYETMFVSQNLGQLYQGGTTLARFIFDTPHYDAVDMKNNMKIVIMTLKDQPQDGILRYTTSYSLVSDDTLVSGLEGLNNTSVGHSEDIHDILVDV